MKIKRRLHNSIKSYIDKPEIIILTGMRRVGKTTLLNMLFDEIDSDNKVFLDLENPLEQMIFDEINYNNILLNLKEFGINSNEKAFVFIDEIQVAPETVKAIKYIYDHYKVKFVLTGSSSFYLKKLFPESLAGRKIIFELFPLDFEEFLLFKNIEKDFTNSFHAKSKNKSQVSFEKLKALYNEHLNYGGFPQVVLQDNVEIKKQYIKDIFRSYFEKEVTMLADFKKVKVFRDLLLLLLERVGSKLDISKLASIAGVSRDTVYSYLAFLEGTYFIFLVTPYSRNVDREISGTRKVYVCDNGILKMFSSVNEGALFENAIYNNLKKYGELSYYQKRSGAEIDFILVKEKVAIEIKQTANSYDIAKLNRVSSSLSLDENYVISRNYIDCDNIILAHDI
jgi:predicted AAA+ superfamily ATPase